MGECGTVREDGGVLGALVVILRGYIIRRRSW